MGVKECVVQPPHPAPATRLLYLEEKPPSACPLPPFDPPPHPRCHPAGSTPGFLRGGGSVSLVVAGDGDAAVATAEVATATGDLWATKGQEAVGRQCAGDSRLVHAGGEAVAAVELT